LLPLKLFDDVAINLVLVSMPLPALTDYATNEMHSGMPFQHLGWAVGCHQKFNF
jgi:hypothetical protein